MNLIDEIKSLAHAQRDEVIEWRRWMHRHPELSQEEYGTMEFVAERLRSFGLEPRTGIGRTGCMAMLEGGGRSSEVGVRRSEFGVRRSEFGVRSSEFGGWSSEFGGWSSEVGRRRSEVGGRRSAIHGGA